MVCTPLIRHSPLIARRDSRRSADLESICLHDRNNRCLGRWFFDATCIQISPWSIIESHHHHTQFKIVDYHLPPSSTRPAKHPPDESRQSSPVASRPHPPHRSSSTWRAATTPTLGIGRMGAAREKALPSNARHRQPDSAKPSPKAYILIPRTSTTSLPQLHSN